MYVFYVYYDKHIKRQEKRDRNGNTHTNRGKEIDRERETMRKIERITSRCYCLQKTSSCFEQKRTQAHNKNEISHKTYKMHIKGSTKFKFNDCMVFGISRNVDFSVFRKQSTHILIFEFRWAKMCCHLAYV